MKPGNVYVEREDDIALTTYNWYESPRAKIESYGLQGYLELHITKESRATDSRVV